VRILVERCRFWPSGSGSVLLDNGLVERVSQDETLRVPEGTTILDGAWGTLLPGLIDSHCHPFELGWLKRNLDLRGTSNITGLRLRLSSKVHRASPGEWLAGRGWDHEAFQEKRLPTRHDIDDLTPENPVVLSRVCGHIGLLNTKAIELLGLEARFGEEYDRDEAGSLTGIVRERSLEEVYARMPGVSVQSCESDLLSAELEAATVGLTALHTIVSSERYREELEALAILHREGRLSLKHRVYVPPESLEYIEEKNLGSELGDNSVKINGVKLYADGSLGARTAALRQPYADDPGNSGLLRYTDDQLAGRVQAADSKGYQAIIHAIGDRAVEQAIGALAPVTGSRNPLRHRIEHASLLPKDLLSKIEKYRIHLAVQPGFRVADFWARERLGDERVRDLYPFRSISEAGITVSGGSDAPVESIRPIVGMWAATAKEGSMGEDLGIEQAVDLYTKGAAVNGRDYEYGRVREGAPADLTLLDSEIRAIHSAMLRKVGVAATLVMGHLVFSYAGFAQG